MKKQIRMNLKEQTNFVKLLNEMAYEHSAYDVFCDFLTMSCYSIANAAHYKKERESKYLEIIGKYKKMFKKVSRDCLDLFVWGLKESFVIFLVKFTWIAVSVMRGVDSFSLRTHLPLSALNRLWRR